jgi:3-isopropylmalate/(R)-2-methylmalate dehydratase small subunit
MQPFKEHTGVVAVLDRVNVDTDQIIPKQFLKRVERTGFGQFLFFDWRYQEGGQINPDFELNQPGLENASILVAGRNFGCGSSREHAAWALQDYGFRVLIAPSFADIFYNNCAKNGILLITAPDETVNQLVARARVEPGFQVTADLQDNLVTDGAGLEFRFEMDSFRRHSLLNGLDDIGLTLHHAEEIRRYEEANLPWERIATI